MGLAVLVWMAPSELHAGDAIEVGIGRAVIDPSRPAPGVAPSHAPSPPGAADPAPVKTDDAGASDSAVEEKRQPRASGNRSHILIDNQGHVKAA